MINVPAILHRDRIVIVRDAVTGWDDYGDPIHDKTRTTVDGCNVQPMSQPEEALGNRDQVVSRWRLFAPVDVDLRADDRIEYDGHTLDVDGEPQRWRSPFLAHTEAYLKRWEG